MKLGVSRSPNVSMPRSFYQRPTFSDDARRVYRRLGIREFIIRDIVYSYPQDLQRVLQRRGDLGAEFSRKLKRGLGEDSIHATIEERSKRMRRVLHKLTRHRVSDLFPETIRKLLNLFNLDIGLSPLGTIRDWYGVRVIHDGPISTSYRVLETVLKVAQITDGKQLSSLMDYLIVPARSYVDSEFDHPYRAIHVAFIYEGIPIEVQIRTQKMHQLALTTVKRPGLD